MEEDKPVRLSYEYMQDFSLSLSEIYNVEVKKEFTCKFGRPQLTIS